MVAFADLAEHLQSLWSTPMAHTVETGVARCVAEATQGYRRQHGHATMSDVHRGDAINRREYPGLADEALPHDPEHPDFKAALESRYDDLEKAYHRTEAYAVGGTADTSAQRHAAMQELLPSADQRVGALDTPEQRLAVLNRLTQNTRADAEGEPNVACVPTSLLAGALLSGGSDGLSAVLEGMRVAGNTLPEVERKKLEEQLATFRGRMFATEPDKGLTLGDLQSLSRSLYGSLKRIEGRDPEDDWKNGKGTSSKAVERFTDWSPGLAEMMKKNHVALRTMRAPGDLAMPHEVLQVGDGEGATSLIYDPWARINGQLVADAGQIDAYQSTF